MRDLGRAEVALAKADLQTFGTSLFVTLATSIAACVLVGIALATTAAMIVLHFDGSASAALGAASATIMLLAIAAVIACLRMLPASRSSRTSFLTRPHTDRTAP